MKNENFLCIVGLQKFHSRDQLKITKDFESFVKNKLVMILYKDQCGLESSTDHTIYFQIASMQHLQPKFDSKVQNMVFVHDFGSKQAPVFMLVGKKQAHFVKTELSNDTEEEFKGIGHLEVDNDIIFLYFQRQEIISKYNDLLRTHISNQTTNGIKRSYTYHEKLKTQKSYPRFCILDLIKSEKTGDYVLITQQKEKVLD